jgi:NitT/TauT family transport system permease protein
VRGPLSRALPYAVFLGLWQGLAWWLGPRILPGPGPVLRALAWSLADPGFLLDILSSLGRSSAGIALGLAAAYPLGLLLGASPGLDRLASPIVSLTYPVPKVLLLPALLIALGLGEAPKVALVALTVGYQVLVVTRDSALGLDPRYRESFLCVWPGGPGGAGGARFALSYARHVLVPWTLPAAMTSLRLASGTAVAVLFMAESFATGRGLGHAIMDSWGNMDLPRMFAGIVAMGALGGLFFWLSGLLERALCPWGAGAGRGGRG